MLVDAPREPRGSPTPRPIGIPGSLVVGSVVDIGNVNAIGVGEGMGETGIGLEPINGILNP
jgi:hypothetical protein